MFFFGAMLSQVARSTAVSQAARLLLLVGLPNAFLLAQGWPSSYENSRRISAFPEAQFLWLAALVANSIECQGPTAALGAVGPMMIPLENQFSDQPYLPGVLALTSF